MSADADMHFILLAEKLEAVDPTVNISEPSDQRVCVISNFSDKQHLDHFITEVNGIIKESGDAIKDTWAIEPIQNVTILSARLYHRGFDQTVAASGWLRRPSLYVMLSLGTLLFANILC